MPGWAGEEWVWMKIIIVGGGHLGNELAGLLVKEKHDVVVVEKDDKRAEYLGENEGVPADVHWTQETMTCTKCHSTELHGSGEVTETRYQNSATAQCEDCHEDVWTDTAGNPQHAQHIGDLSCQVCHSVEYKGCYNCHVAVSEEGTCYFTTDPSEMQFKIGRNPLRSPERPYKYVVLRHIPANPDLFASYGDNLFSNFDALPTWKYATPHNIQLHTPQNASCDSCHGHAELFLMEQDVSPAEREANRGVIVPQIPGALPPTPE